MECLSSHQRENLFSAMEYIKTESFNEKKASSSDHLNIDILLDRILDFQNHIRGKRQQVDDFIETIEKVTWVDSEIDEELLRTINEVIVNASDWRVSLKRNYKDAGVVNGKEIATTEVGDLMSSLEDLKDAINDLEEIFFKLPNTPGFAETTKELDLI